MRFSLCTRKLMSNSTLHVQIKLMCKFECSIGLKEACRERKNTWIKTEVSFVFLVTVEGLTNWMDYVGFSCISCQPFLPPPSSAPFFSICFLSLILPLFIFFTELILHVCKRHFFPLAEMHFMPSPLPFRLPVL